MSEFRENFAPSETKMIGAIEADDAGLIRSTIAAGAQVNAVGRFEMTPLMYAVLKNKPAAVEALLEAGADPNAKSINNETPVTLAARVGGKDHTLMMLLLKKGGNSNTLRPDGSPLLSGYIDSYDLDGIRLLASYSANLNALSRTRTPLIIEAAMMEAWDVVWVLIELGADFRAAEVRGVHRLDIPKLMANHEATPPDSPIWPWKVRVWKYLKSKGVAVPELPGLKTNNP